MIYLLQRYSPALAVCDSVLAHSRSLCVHMEFFFFKLSAVLKKICVHRENEKGSLAVTSALKELNNRHIKKNECNLFGWLH